MHQEVAEPCHVPEVRDEVVRKDVALREDREDVRVVARRPQVARGDRVSTDGDTGLDRDDEAIFTPQGGRRPRAGHPCLGGGAGRLSPCQDGRATPAPAAGRPRRSPPPVGRLGEELAVQLRGPYLHVVGHPPGQRLVRDSGAQGIRAPPRHALRLGAAQTGLEQDRDAGGGSSPTSGRRPEPPTRPPDDRGPPRNTDPGAIVFVRVTRPAPIVLARPVGRRSISSERQGETQ